MLPQELNKEIVSALQEAARNDKGGISTELEAKFGHYEGTRFVSTVDRTTFNRVKAHFDKSIEPSFVHSVDYSFKNIRKTENKDSQDVTWLSKDRLWNKDIPDYGIRISSSRETILRVPPKSFIPEYVREKERYSYVVFSNEIRVDMTIVKSDRVTYEIEIELLPTSFPAVQRAKTFEKAIYAVRTIVDDTHILYKNKERFFIVNSLNSTASGGETKKKGYVDHSILVQARNLKIRDLVWGGLLGNPNTSYTVTYKTDGERRMMYFSKSGIWLINSTSMNKVTNVEIPEFTGTILDGELVPMNKRRDTEVYTAPRSKYWFLVFDTIAWKDDIKVQEMSHLQRMAYAQNAVDATKSFYDSKALTVSTKSFLVFDIPVEFFERMREAFRQLPLLPYVNDGLMFTPTDAVYNPHSDNVPIYKRKMIDMPDIAKWKPKEELTIDFQIQGGKLYSGERGGKLVEFDKLKVIDSHPLTDGLPEDSIVEYGYDYENEYLVPRRVRYDKIKPNRKDVADDVADDILNPIDASTLQGDTFALLRRYHNTIKKSLFEMSLEGTSGKSLLDNKNKNRYLLDIGSGYGGDLFKWRGFSRIVAVEPDLEHIEELKRRIASAGMQDKIYIVHAGGEDTGVISAAVTKWFRGEKADVVSNMLSLTFFWQNYKLIDSLSQTIVQNVKPGGKYIFLTMDGNQVEKVFKEDARTKMKLGPATLEYDGKNQLQINIEGTIVENQTEWLVRLVDLEKRLAKSGFKLTMLERANQELFLTPEETVFSSMYSYGIFTQNEKNVEVVEVVEVAEVEEEKEQNEENEQVLSSLPPEKSQLLNTSWWNSTPVSRIGNVKTGDDFENLVSAIFNGYLKDFQVVDEDKKKKFVKDFIREIQEDTREPNEINIDTVVSIIGVDVYIVEVTDSDVYFVSKHVADPNRPKRSAVISTVFDTISLVTNKGFRTPFEPNDPFIQTFR